MILKATLHLLVLALCVVDFIAAVPTLYSEHDFDFNVTDYFDGGVHLAQKRQNAKVDLRIMPLGASIVNGADESQGNG